MKKKDKSQIKKSPLRSGDFKKWVSIIFLLMFLEIVITTGQVRAAGRTVRVGVYQNEPKIFLDAGGHASGIYIDLLTKIGTEEGWKLIYVSCQWSDCLAALGNGQIDLMPDVAYSTERTQIYDFNLTPVLESWSQIYASSHVKVNGLATWLGCGWLFLRTPFNKRNSSNICTASDIRSRLCRPNPSMKHSNWQEMDRQMWPSPTISSETIFTNSMGW